MSIQGKEAQKLTRETLGDTIAALERRSAQEIDWLGTRLTVIRASHTSENGFDIMVEARRAGDLWDALVNVGARPLGFKAFETLRIEAGESRYGADVDETNVVSETNLDDAVSFTKGCYIGQEIIARIKYRGHVAKKLTGIKFAAGANVTTGAKLLSRDEKEIGRLTSVAFSPHLNCTVALGYVKYDYLAAGTPVKVFAGEQSIDGTVTELPFIRGSWYESS